MHKTEAQEIHELNHFFDRYKHRERRTESDCAIVEQVWKMFRDSKHPDVRSAGFAWLLARVEDKKTNDLARIIICWHLYRNRKSLTKGQRRRFRKALKHLPRKNRKTLKRLAR